MKTLIFLLLTMFMIISCSSNDNPTNKGVYIDTGINLIIKNNLGEDLLLPSTPNTLNTDEIELYYLLDGQKEKVFIGNLTYPKNYFIYNYINSKAITIFPDYQSKDEFPVTYVKWNSTDTDTIKCHFNRGNKNDGKYISCDKVWFNNKLVYPTTENQKTGRFINLIK